MRQTTAERQRAYRERHLREGTSERLSIVVSASAKARLARLARHHGVSQRAMLERVLEQAEDEAVGQLGNPSPYFDPVTR